MKCIKQGDVIRKVDNKIAIDLFHNGKATLVPKHVFKEAHGKGVSETVAKAGSKTQMKKNRKKENEVK